MNGIFDTQVIIYAGLTCGVILIALIVLAVTNRRVRFLLSEVQSLRREMKLVDEALQTVTSSLERQSKAPSNG